METSVRLGRIAGVDVGINWSWLLVVLLMTWTLAAGLFPETNPGLADGAYWAMAVVATLLFFGSLLLHELGHALQARADGVAIEGITLWLFGGVARLRGRYPSAGAELRIAAAGPLVTAAIAAVLLGLAAAASLPDGVDGVVSWLGVINVSLLAFNLLPAVPLDGGRLLHAALWSWRGDLAWATRTAGAVGAGFGWLLIGGGVALFVATSAFGGLWLALIGWFVQAAAGAEAAQATAREALRGRPVRALMIPDPVAVAPDLTLGRFVDEVAHRTGYTTYPVVDGERPVGLLTVAAVAARPRATWDRATVDECMLPRERVAVVDPDADAGDALDALMEEPRRALVVDGGGRLVGLLSITDAVRAVERAAVLGGPRRDAPPAAPCR
jgi:Zn-dependent protease/CBS domain-containing protein